MRGGGRQKTKKEANRKTGRQTKRPTGRKTGRQTKRPTGRKTGRQREEGSSLNQVWYCL